MQTKQNNNCQKTKQNTIKQHKCENLLIEKEQNNA